MINVCYPFVGDSIGGSHISTVTLIKSLQRKEIDLYVKVLVFSSNDRFTRYLSKNKIPFEDLSLRLSGNTKVGIIIDLFRSINRLIGYLNREKIDIVHTNDLRTSLIFLVASKLTSTKHLWHQRTSMPKSFIGQRIFLLCNKFLTVSNYVKSQIRVNTKSDKIIRVYNPIDSRLATNEEIKERLNSFKKKKTVIGYLANITSQKNADVFVDLARLLSVDVNHNFEFVMIGRADEIFIKQVEDYKKNGELDNSFNVLGFKTDIDEYLSNIDFMIVPAKGDGFGRTLVESMRAGVIVIALDSGGHKEIIKHKEDGFLVKDLDAKSFVDSLLEIYNDKELFQLILQSAHKKVKSLYTVDQHSNEILSIYHAMLGIKKE